MRNKGVLAMEGSIHAVAMMAAGRPSRLFENRKTRTGGQRLKGVRKEARACTRHKEQLNVRGQHGVYVQTDIHCLDFRVENGRSYHISFGYISRAQHAQSIGALARENVQ